MYDTKLTNPKDVIGSSKLPLHLVPAVITAYACLAFLEGALKYGVSNWRAAGVRSSIYFAATLRHLWKWWNGEEADPKTNVPHLASAIACIGIILDARVVKKLNDDRPPAVPMGDVMDQLGELVDKLKTLFAEHKPRHWSIADTAEIAGEPNEVALPATRAGFPTPRCVRCQSDPCACDPFKGTNYEFKSIEGNRIY